ncbi:cingulin isoform X3 [Notothenia coriiceps]|uniref:Cingulin isoform X3 n=1 Tax=Notothenia coriiceps TaxID=8208 RepID=A0A6I9MXN8_9TELE|nr:PREDICTED: cingulin-like isoform X3 [Notothenia coriiceps]
MFRPSYRSSSPFSLSDLDMWDTKSRFTAQSSAWCGSATVSGTGFLSDVSSSTSGSTGGFRQSDPGLRKWQSLSHLAPECATQPFPPSPGSVLRFARGESSFRQAEGAHWLQDAHKRLDTQLDRLRMRNSPLSHNITASQLLDMKHKQLSETLATLEQEKEAAELSQFEKSHQRRALQERVLQLEKELLHLRSTLDRRSHDQPTERNLDSPGGTLPKSQDNFNRQVTQNVDLELCKLRDALRDAEARAKTKEDELNQALKKLQISTETQQTLLNQIEETNQRRQNLSTLQEELSEANNKISRACLEKAILSTQMLKLEENIKELKAKLTGFDKDHLIQERTQQGSEGCQSQSNQETVQTKEDLKSLKEVHEKLTGELEEIKQKLKTSQSQLQEETLERLTISKRITGLEADCAQLTTEREELLSRVSGSGHEEITAIKEKCHLLRESVEVLELEKQKLQDRCMYLEAGVLEREEKLQLQEVEHRKQDAGRLQSNEELKAVASHWAQKWQRLALTLQSTQEELEEVKKYNSRNESDLLLKAELGACKQQLELERSRTLLHRCEDKGTDALAQTEDRGTQTELSESSLLWEPSSASHRSQNKAPKSSEDQDDGNQATIWTSNSLRSQLEESRRRTRQLQEEETLSDQRLQTLRQLYPVQDEIPSGEGRKDKTVSPLDPETDQQRRMVTEQLKNLFKEREGKEMETVDNRLAAGENAPSSPEDWTQTSKGVRNSVDRRIWQHGSGLMPVFEEDEEECDCPGGEEARVEENWHNQSQQQH